MKQRTKKYKMSTVEKAVAIFEERDFDEMAIAEQDEETAVAVFDPLVFIPELKITAARASFLQYDADSEEFLPDWDGVALFESNGEKLSYVMMEQDDLLLTLYNRYHLNSDVMLQMKAAIFDGVEKMIETVNVSNNNVTKVA